MRNYTVDELAEMIVDTVLEEQFLNKRTLLPRVTALVKTMVDLKNVPKDYNAYESHSARARRLRTIEQKDAEIRFWRDKIKALDGGNIETYYQEQHALLVELGFKKP